MCSDLDERHAVERGDGIGAAWGWEDVAHVVGHLGDSCDG